MSRLYMSPPCVGEEEREAVKAAFDSKYVAPCGPMVDEFERRLAKLAGRKHAVAVSSGTAAIDLVMDEYGVDGSWTVVAPTLTFIATVGPAARRGAGLVFVDCERTGLADAALVEATLKEYSSRAPKLMYIAVDLYGKPVEYSSLETICRRYGAVFVCDSAEAVGAHKSGRAAGGAGTAAIYSFNGNKMITTSGGGALLTDDDGVAMRAKKRSQQSRENVPWYEHVEVGHNYRLSNILAGIGLAQLAKLPQFLERRAQIKAAYKQALAPFGFEFLSPVEGENNWLTIALAENEKKRDDILAALEKNDIEARPVWKPMHLQRVFSKCRFFGGDVAEDLFRRGLCLPSGPAMTDDDVERVVAIAREEGRGKREETGGPHFSAAAREEESGGKSGGALARLRAGASVVILGAGKSAKAAETLLAKYGARTRLLSGDDAFPDSPQPDFAVASPGIPPRHPWRKTCEERDIRVVSELQLGVEELRRRGVKLLAVTGSKGKSSVVKLLADALGGVPCGNYGLPVCATGDCEWAVVEVSSFQMETSVFAPGTFEAAAVLNLQEDHLDRHGSIARYHALKLALLKGARFAIDCKAEGEAGLLPLLAGSYFDNPILRTNGAIAAAMLRATGLDDAAIRRAFASFKPLAHRMNPVGTVRGVLCIDDSKSTSIASLAAALEMATRPVRLIAGGLEKGDEPKIAISPLTKRGKKVYLIGHSAEMFFSAWREHVDCEVCGTLERAVERAFSEAQEGEILLLSPGTASFDQFNNFEERGDAFANLVNKEGQTKR